MPFMKPPANGINLRYGDLIINDLNELVDVAKSDVDSLDKEGWTLAGPPELMIEEDEDDA